ncbi:hypothetical protein HUJ04_005175 [Dendroctonus ponderosae]|nr:hypothetical protein HUJ04_005175 [Dendroctonus ponderosae]
MTNVIGKSAKSDIINKVKATKFSLLVDESTDITVTKTACIVVRFYSESSGKVVALFSEACKSLSRTCEDSELGTFIIFLKQALNGNRNFNILHKLRFTSFSIHDDDETRWLSLGQVVSRLLEQWSAPQLFFNEKYLDQRL